MNLENNQLEDVSNIGLNHKKGIFIGLFEEVLFQITNKYLFIVSTSITLPSLLEGLVLFLFIMSRNSRKFNLSLPVYKTFFCNQLNYFIKSCFQLYCTYLQHNAKTGMDKLFIAMCRKLNFASWKRQFCLIRYGNFQGNFFCLGKLKYKKILAKFVLYDFDQKVFHVQLDSD